MRGFVLLFVFSQFFFVVVPNGKTNGARKGRKGDHGVAVFFRQFFFLLAPIDGASYCSGTRWGGVLMSQGHRRPLVKECTPSAQCRCSSWRVLVLKDSI